MKCIKLLVILILAASLAFAQTKINPATQIKPPSGSAGVTQFITGLPSGVTGWNPPGVVTNAQTGASYTYLATDRAGYVSFSNGGAIAVTLPQAGSAGFASNWVNVSCDIGAGTATITPTISTISYSTGAAYTSAAASLPLATGQCAWIYSDNSNYFAIVRAGAAAGSGVSVSGSTVSWNPTDPTIQYLAFYPLGCGNPGVGTGNGAFGFTSIGTGTQAVAAPTWPEFCTVKITDSATNPSGGVLSVGDTPTLANYILPFLAANSGWQITERFALGQTGTTTFYFGVAEGTTASAIGTSFIGVRYDTAQADANFTFVTISKAGSTNGAGTTALASGTAANANFHTITMTGPVAGEIDFQIDGGAKYCITSSVSSPGCAGGNATSAFVPNNANTDPVFFWENLSTTTARTATIENWVFKATGLSR